MKIRELLDYHDSEKIKDLYKDNWQYFYRIAYRILGNKEKSEDCVEMAYHSIINNFDRIKALDKNVRMAYCTTIVKNTAYGIYKKEKPFVPYPMEVIEGDNQEGVEKLLLKNEELQYLNQAIKELKADEKELLSLRYEEGLTFKEIGEFLDISEEAAKKRGQRLIYKLRGLMDVGEDYE